MATSPHRRADPDLHWFLPSQPRGTLWGAGTDNLRRSHAGDDVWDANCRASPLIGGYEAMLDMRAHFRSAIADATSRAPSNEHPRGHVYLAGWRVDSRRDISDTFTPGSPQGDESVLGWLLRLIDAGISVRVLLWLPSRTAAATSFNQHAKDHVYIARVIQAYSALKTPAGASEPLGVCLLDRRLPQSASSHHQKLTIIRVGAVNVAYCGGIDLAYTRKDSPGPSENGAHRYTSERPQFLDGDPQSGENQTVEQTPWRDNSVGAFALPAVPNTKPHNDLPSHVYGSRAQYWHDQHVRLEGPVVTTLEWAFYERWMDDCSRRPSVLAPERRDRILKTAALGEAFGNADLIVTTSAALTPDGAELANLMRPEPIRSAPHALSTGNANACVQVWRTVPLRSRGTTPRYFSSGEYTVLAGVANAIGRATELILLFDQYFWSLPLAAQLNARLYAEPGLRVIIVVPPYADGLAGATHWARRRAYDTLEWVDPSRTDALPHGIRPQIAAYAPWHAEQNRGIYMHAKAHIYDARLLLIGSANCNARSFTGDTELVAAIQDTSAIYAHMVRLWNVFLPNSPWPWDAAPFGPASLPINSAGWGKAFFDNFVAEANTLDPATGRPQNNVTPDAVYAGGTLPNGVEPKQSRAQHYILSRASDTLEARGIRAAVEYLDGSMRGGVRPLIDIAQLLEHDPRWRVAP